MKPEKVKEILNSFGASVKKHYGQNFLLDENVLNNIVRGSLIDKNTCVVEIGPGLGFLTEYLSKNAKKVLCYEIDSEMVEVINSRGFDNVCVINDDFLNRNLNEDFDTVFEDEKVVLVANLPYYITTPILLKVLEETSRVKSMTVMMQKEVALRICGKPSTKDYNSLSVLMQYFTNPKVLFHVSPKSFYPEPGVDSSVIYVGYKEKLDFEALDLEYFLKFNRNIFAMRRKTLLNNLQRSYNYDKVKMQEIIESLNLPLTVRSEALSVKEIVTLANKFFETFIKM